MNNLACAIVAEVLGSSQPRPSFILSKSSTTELAPLGLHYLIIH